MVYASDHENKSPNKTFCGIFSNFFLKFIHIFFMHILVILFNENESDIIKTH